MVDIKQPAIYCLLVCSVGLVSTTDDLTNELQQRLNDLEQHIRSQDKRILSLEREISEQRTQLKLTNEKLVFYLTANRNNSVLESEKWKRDVNPLPNIDGRAEVPKVAFSSYLDHVVNHVGIESIIPFNQVILNDGGAYNTITGIFTVPVTGVYLFHYSVNTQVRAYQLVVKLVLDNVNMSDGTSDPFHDKQEIQGGNTVMFRANQGQSVWLAAYNTGDTIVDGRKDYRFSTFSGVLLYT